jgi:hypothetical protein
VGSATHNVNETHANWKTNGGTLRKDRIVFDAAWPGNRAHHSDETIHNGPLVLADPRRTQFTLGVLDAAATVTSDDV